MLYPVASATFDSDLNTLTLSFAGILPDGNYEAFLYSQAITDSVGQHLGANPDGTGGADANLSFYSLAGDVNRDGVVDFKDVNLTYNVAGGYAQGDVNGDGYVDSADAIIIARNYQKRIPPLPSQPSATPSSNTNRTTTGPTSTPSSVTTPVAPPPKSPKGGKPTPHAKGPKPVNSDSNLRIAASISSTPVTSDPQAKDKKTQRNRAII